MSAVLRLVEEPDGRPTTREAVEELLADNPERWWAFEEAALDGVPALRGSILGFRGALRARGHAFETHEEQFGETFMALLAVAEELLPGSPGAARARLRGRVRDDVRPRSDGGVKIAGSVDCHRAVEVVLAFEDKLFDEVIVAAIAGHTRLNLVARSIRDGLAQTGREYPAEEVGDELWMVVREVMPNTRAARPDTAHLEEMWARAQAYVEGCDPGGVLGGKRRQEHEVRALRAVRDHDPPGLRTALRELCRAARDASREERRDGGRR